jgi:hypothetical protein
VVIEHLPGDPRDLADLRPRDPRDRIEIDAKLVGPIHVLAAHRVRVEVDAPEVHHVDQLRGVVDDDLVGASARWKRERGDVDPGRPPDRRPLLVERLALGPVDEPLQDLRPAGHAAQRALGEGEIVLHQLELGDAGLRKIDLVRIRHGDLVSGEQKDLLLGLRHPRSLARSAAGPHGFRPWHRPPHSACCSGWPCRWSWRARASP